MKGNNSMTVCPALMIEMAQEWIDRNIATKPMVQNICMQGDQFLIRMTDTRTDEKRGNQCADAPK